MNKYKLITHKRLLTNRYKEVNVSPVVEVIEEPIVIEKPKKSKKVRELIDEQEKKIELIDKEEEVMEKVDKKENKRDLIDRLEKAMIEEDD